MFEPLDLLTFALLGGALAAIAAMLGLGRSEGWLHAGWIVVTLLVAPPSLLAAGVIELRRATPLIDLRWLTHGDVWRFASAVFLIRLVLAEQEAALGTVRALGGRTHDLASLAAVMLASAVAGGSRQRCMLERREDRATDAVGDRHRCHRSVGR